MPFFPTLPSFASLQFLEFGLLLLAECVVSEKLTVEASELLRRLYVGVHGAPEGAPLLLGLPSSYESIW